MRKVVVLEQFSFEDVLPPPGWPEEDASGRFAYGGWVGSYSDVVVNYECAGAIQTESF
jgi:hypothetical protein